MVLLIFRLCYNIPDMLLATTLYTNVVLPGFWNQPIDIILYELLIWFGWIPIVVVTVWGFVQVWQNTRQEKWVKSLKWVLVAIDVPAVTEQTPKSLENMFASLWGGYSNLTWKEKWIIGKTQPLFSFEIVSTEGYVQFYMRTLVRYRDVAEAGIYAAYPEAEICEGEDYTAWAPAQYPDEVWDCWGTELKLKELDIFPLRTYLDFEDKISGELKDPLGGILEQLAKMKPGEHFWVQIIVQPDGIAAKKWKTAGESFINKTFGVEKKHAPGFIDTMVGHAMSIPNEMLNQAMGTPPAAPSHNKMDDDMWKAFKITMAEKEKVEGVLKKIGKTGYKVKMRLVYVARKGVYDKQARTAFVKGMFHQFSHLNLNALGLHGDATPKDDYFWQAWTYPARQGKLIRAFRNRSWGMGADPWILNTEELASLWHFPSLLVKAPLVKKAEAKRGEPPVGLPIGSNEDHHVASRPMVSQADIDHHGETSVSAHAAEEPEIHLPEVPHDPHAATVTSSHADVHMPPSQVASHPPAAVSHHAEEEIESGLDATDMGPPADVELPGPPPGWSPSAKASEDKNVHEDTPPNLPV